MRAIEEVRGVFKNLPTRDPPEGRYRLELVKQIRDEKRRPGHGVMATADRRKATGERNDGMRKASRARMLMTLDRDHPIRQHA